jgi:hypothetical protein
MIVAEIDAEMDRIVQRVGRERKMDLEASEFFIRTSVLAVGARALERLLAGVGSGRRDSPVVCRCGRKMKSQGLKAKTVTTVLGAVRFSRSRYVCPDCGASRFPGDVALGIEDATFSPGAQRMMARAGSNDSYNHGREDLKLYAGLDLTAKDIERVAKAVGRRIAHWMEVQATQAQLRAASGQPQPDAPQPGANAYVSFDGTGAPVRAEERAGRKGKQPDGSARTREVKLGCVFTSTTQDDHGRPVRDPLSTTYVGAIENSRDFGCRIHAEAVRRGVDRTDNLVCLSDGAPYNKTIVAEHFPQATHIIDLYHAREKLCETAKLISTEAQQTQRQSHWQALLDEGHIESMLQQIRQHLPRSGPRRNEALKKIKYFEDNAPQMRYKQFREHGYFVGSGVIEAGCKTVIGKRLKQSGMFWSVAGANAIIALRCCLKSGRFEQFWEDQAT